MMSISQPKDVQMPPVEQNALSSEEITEYLDNSDDFAFELRCLELLSELTNSGIEIATEHSGTYEDPITHKPRQFDIRARVTNGDRLLSCAIECKNLQPSRPLIVMCVPRTERENFHELVVSHPANPVEHFGVTRRVRSGSLYPLEAFVGKTCSQLKRDKGTGAVSGGSSEVYERWSQAIASAEALATEAPFASRLASGFCQTIVLPVLVVPDGTLWRVDFNSKGQRVIAPTLVDRCSHYIERVFALKGYSSSVRNFTMSHLEVTTLSGLSRLISNVVLCREHWVK